MPTRRVSDPYERSRACQFNIFCKAQLNIFIETARYKFQFIIIIIIIINVVTSANDHVSIVTSAHEHVSFVTSTHEHVNVVTSAHEYVFEWLDIQVFSDKDFKP